MKNLIFLLLFCLALLTESAKSQSPFSVYVGGGACWYYGDLQPSSFPNLKTIGLSGQGGLRYQFYRKFAVALNYQYDLLKGADGYSTEIPRKNRNLGFYNHTHEISLRLSYDFLRSDRFKIVPYVFAGFGYFRSKPKAFDGTELQPLGTEGQYIGDNLYPQPYAIWHPSIPLGIGVRYRISCRFSLKLEFTYHKTFNDFIDDASSNYPSLAALSATPNGATAVTYSDRRLALPPDVYGSRGNSDRVDNFADINIGLIIHFTRCKGRSGGIYEDCKALYKNLDKQ